MIDNTSKLMRRCRSK